LPRPHDYALAIGLAVADLLGFLLQMFARSRVHAFGGAI